MPPTVELCPDPLVKSPNVAALNTCNFYEFLDLKDVTFVMFYDPTVPACSSAAKDVAIAASCTKRPNHGYGAVDCTQNKDLCITNLAWTFPTFKVYSSLYPVTTVRDQETYSSEEMRQHVEQAQPPPWK